MAIRKDSKILGDKIIHKNLSEVFEVSIDAKALDQIINLYMDCFNDPDKSENWTYETAKAYFNERIGEGSRFFAIKDQDQIIAVVMGSDYEKSFLSKEIDLVAPNSFYISLIASSHSYRGQGLSSRIMKYVEGCLPSYKSMVARCRVENEPVRALFKKFSYIEVNRYSAELGGVVCERLILKKEL